MWWAWYNQLKGFKSTSVASWRRKMMFSLWSVASACAQEVQPAFPEARPCGTLTHLSSYSLSVTAEALHSLPALSSPVCHLGARVRACHLTFHRVPHSRPSNFVCHIWHACICYLIHYILCHACQPTNTVELCEEACGFYLAFFSPRLWVPDTMPGTVMFSISTGRTSS